MVSVAGNVIDDVVVVYIYVVWSFTILCIVTRQNLLLFFIFNGFHGLILTHVYSFLSTEWAY